MNKVISDFLSYLKIPVSESYCERLLASHPDYPSLLSIVDVFERLGIPLVVGKIEKDKIEDLTFPYLLQLDKQYGEVIIIKSKNDLVKRKDDLQHWNGVVLQVAPPTAIHDKKNNESFEKENFVQKLQNVLLSGVAILLVFCAVYNFSSVPVTLLATSVMGVVVGYFLVAKELGIKYKVVENFCNTGKNSNCDNILNSDDAKLTRHIKISDTVLAYFLFQSFFLLLGVALPHLKASIFSPLSILSLLLIPVVIYSIYYQYAKAKSWCRLCLVVDGILIVQSGILGYLNISTSLNEVRYEVLILQLLVFIIISCVVLIFKNKLEVNNDLSKLIPSASRVKNNPNVFTHLLRQQRQVNAKLMDREVAIGHRDAPINIIMVSNLYCKPCKEQHEVAEQLVNAFPEKVNVSFRFVVSKDEKANHYLIEYWLRFIHSKNEEPFRTQKLLNDWYSMMDLKRFIAKYPMEGPDDFSGGIEIERRHSKWIERIKIPYTPTLFVNGYELAKGYELGDIVALLPSLSEELKHQIPQEQNFEVNTSDLVKV